jgi:hypothetical protein
MELLAEEAQRLDQLGVGDRDACDAAQIGLWKEESPVHAAR